MTKMLTLSWNGFLTANEAPPRFEDLLSSVMADQSALRVEIDPNGVSLTSAPEEGSNDFVSVSGVWMTPRIACANKLPMSAKLWLPLLFRARSISMPFSSISSPKAMRRAAASVVMRNIFNGIISGIDVRYDDISAVSQMEINTGREMAAVYQHVLAHEMDEPALKERNFLETAMIAVHFDIIELRSPMLASGRRALGEYLHRNSALGPSVADAMQLREELFACFK